MRKNLLYEAIWGYLVALGCFFCLKRRCEMKRIGVLLLGFVITFYFVGIANAGMIGDTIRLEYHVPNVGDVYAGITTTVETGTADQWEWASLCIVNPEHESIEVAGVASWTINPSSFSGLVVSDIDDTVQVVTVDTNLAGWDNSRLFFDDHSIRFNFGGLEFLATTYLNASIIFEYSGYLTLYEAGYTQEVINNDVEMTPEPYQSASNFTDWDGNWYFVPFKFDSPISQKSIQKVTPVGVMSQFARVNQAPDETRAFRCMNIDVFGNLYVVLYHYIEDASTTLYPLIKVSGFTPLSESIPLADLQTQADKHEQRLFPSGSPPELNPIGNQTGKAGEWFIIRSISATDTSGDYLTIKADVYHEGMRFFQTISEPGHVEYKLRWPAQYVTKGRYNMTFTVSDGLNTDSEAITITINP